MTYNKYFDQVWANSGIVTPISDAVTGDGTVNYPQGWTSLYQTNISSGGKKMDLGAWNQAWNDVTGAVQQLQNYGQAFTIATGAWVSNTTATFTGTLLGTAYSQTLNTATSGAGGLDIGSLAASTWYYVYAIFNPSTSTPSILMSLSATGPTLPSGYTFSYLIGSIRIDGSSHIVVFNQIRRKISIVSQTALSTSTQQASPTSLSISSIIPPNAVSCQGNLNGGATGSWILSVYSTSSQVGAQTAWTNSNTACPFIGLDLVTPQTIYYVATTVTGTPVFQIYISGFSI